MGQKTDITSQARFLINGKGNNCTLETFTDWSVSERQEYLLGKYHYEDFKGLLKFATNSVDLAAISSESPLSTVVWKDWFVNVFEAFIHSRLIKGQMKETEERLFSYWKQCVRSDEYDYIGVSEVPPLTSVPVGKRRKTAKKYYNIVIPAGEKFSSIARSPGGGLPGQLNGRSSTGGTAAAMSGISASVQSGSVAHESPGGGGRGSVSPSSAKTGLPSSAPKKPAAIDLSELEDEQDGEEGFEEEPDNGDAPEESKPDTEEPDEQSGEDDF